MRRDAMVVSFLVLIARVLTMPRTPWDADELRFPFAAMVAAGIAASVLTAFALTIAFGPLASILFSFSAAVLVHAPAGRPDSLAWMFFALVLVNVRGWSGELESTEEDHLAPALAGVGSPWSAPQREEALTAGDRQPATTRAALHGLLCAAAIACQPQYVLSGIALFFAVLILVLKQRRERGIAGIAFAAAMLPLGFVYGAPENLPWSLSEMSVVRFTLHPWGSKFIALPLLFCVAAGIRPLLREWSPRLEVLMWLAFVHTAVGIAVVDPAEGARWAVPAMMFVAVIASRAGWVGTAIIAALSIWYTYPILRDRVTRDSPPAQAVRAIPTGAVVLFERDAWPGIAGTPLDAGMRHYLDRPEVPLLVFARGRSNARGARVFSHDDHDGYGKLTRNAYRSVALIPLEERYSPLRGVYGMERSEEGESWRWLEPEAEIRLPKRSRSARVEIRLPASAPVDTIEVRVNSVITSVRRGSSSTVEVSLTAPHLFFQASRSFELQAPDTRRVAVQLMRVVTR